jgi:hypothetical protein
MTTAHDPDRVAALIAEMDDLLAKYDAISANMNDVTANRLIAGQAAIDFGVIRNRLVMLSASPTQALAAAGEPVEADTNTLDCGCIVSKGWRCPVHGAP